MKGQCGILFVIFALILASCVSTEADRDRLGRAEALVREHPDSALAILDSIAPYALKNRDLRARAAIVEAEAAYQTSRRLPSDSLLDEVVEYYSPKPDSPRRLRALYLRGYQNYLAERYGNAIVDYLTAEQTAKALSDSTSLGLIYRALGDIYTDTYDWNSALEAYKKSDHYIGENEKYGLWAKYDVAKGFYHMDLSDSCLFMLESIIPMATAANDTNLTCLARKLKVSMLVNTQNYEEAISDYERIIQNYPNHLTDKDYLFLGSAYMHTGNKEKAQECGERIRLLTGDDYTWIDFYADNKSDEAHNFLINEYNDQNKYITHLSQQDFHHVIQEYLKLQSITANQRAEGLQRQRIILTVLALAVLCIVFLAFRIHALRLRQRLTEYMLAADELSGRMQSISSLVDLKSTENDNLRQHLAERIATAEELNRRIQSLSSFVELTSAENDNLRQHLAKKNAAAEGLNEQLRFQASIIDIKNTENEILRRDVRATFINQLSFLKVFTENLYDYQSNQKLQTKLVNQLMELIYSFRPEGHNFKIYEEAINSRYDNLLSRLRTEIPSLNQSEIVIYIYYFLQFSPRCISLFMNCSLTSVYNRKKILKSKITRAASPSASEFLSYLR